LEINTGANTVWPGIMDKTVLLTRQYILLEQQAREKL